MKPCKLFLLSILFSGCFLTSCEKTSNSPNILWIMVEDLSHDIGCYGNPVVNTPNLDRLAREGTRYENVFVTGPVCSASRSAMITGCYQTSINAQNHRTPEEAKTMLPDSIHLITKYFNEAGYYTVLEGPREKELRKTPGPWGSGKTDYNFRYNENEFFQGNSFEDCPKGVPFFTQVNLIQTHRGEWWNLGEKRNPTVDKTSIEIPPYYPDHPITRESFAAYYDAIGILDRQIGMIIDKLDSLGLRENTYIVFTSDHGRPLPRAKQFCYDQGLNIPLIISGPGIEKGKVDKRLLSSLDVSAMLLGLAGIKPSGTIHGHDFISDPEFERDYIVAARDRCDETVFRIRAVRTKQYKYIRNFLYERPYTAQNRYKDTRYPILKLMRELKSEGSLPDAAMPFMADRKPPEELYDVIKDPFELQNLAGESEYENVLNEYRNYLQTWMDSYVDYGQFPEPDSIMQVILDERISKYGF